MIWFIIQQTRDNPKWPVPGAEELEMLQIIRIESRCLMESICFRNSAPINPVLLWLIYSCLVAEDRNRTFFAIFGHSQIHKKW